MNNTGFIEAGTIIRSQGIQGDLVIKLCMEIDSNVQLMYLDLTDADLDNKISYNVKNFSFLDDSLILIRFSEVSGRSQASFLEGKKVFIKNEDYLNKYGSEIYNSKLSGYKIYDHEEKKHLGKIIGLKKIRVKYLEKTLMFVEYCNQPLPIPYEEDIVKYIDHDQKEVYITLPDEFLEVLLTKQ